MKPPSYAEKFREPPSYTEKYDKTFEGLNFPSNSCNLPMVAQRSESRTGPGSGGVAGLKAGLEAAWQARSNTVPDSIAAQELCWAWQ